MMRALLSFEFGLDVEFASPQTPVCPSIVLGTKSPWLKSQGVRFELGGGGEGEIPHMIGIMRQYLGDEANR